MANAEVKTQKTNASVDDYLDQIADDGQRADCKAINEIMKKATGETPAMWGPAIVGYGTCHLVYASGREGDWPKVGFSARKGKTTLYLSPDSDGYQSLLDKLGKHTSSKACLYIKHLSDVDIKVLTKLIENSYQHLAAGTIIYE